jgi:uncharacterized protein YkwD
MQAVNAWRRRCSRVGLVLGALASLVWVTASEGEQTLDSLAAKLVAEMQATRRRAGLERLDRQLDLDRLALERARRVADLPAAQRLSVDTSLREDLDAAGIDRVRRAANHRGLARGRLVGAGTFVSGWRRDRESWASLLDPSYDAVGAAIVRAADGWLVFEAVLVERSPPAPDLTTLEREVLEGVNGQRARHGAPPLVPTAALSAIARSHSEDMARRSYFAHRSPEGSEVWDRARRYGIVYARIAENIQTNYGYDDPVAVAIGAWLDSAAHRKTMLDAGYVETGIGAAESGDGTFYFTQVFLLPPPRR